MRTRLMATILLVAVAVAGCNNASPPPPNASGKGNEGGQARPHGEAPKGKKAAPPRLDD